MLFQSVIVAILAAAAFAHPNNVHKHLHYRHASGGLGRATGTGNGYGNSTGPYGNVTKTVEVSGSPSVVTVTVAPLPVTSGGSTVAPGIADPTACGGSSRSTTTVTSTEVVTVTVDPSSPASSGSSSSSQVAAVTSEAAAASSSSGASSSSSQANSTSESAGAFYQVPSSSSAVAGASSIVSSVVAGASSVVSSAAGAVSSAVASALPTSASTTVQAVSTSSQSSSSASSSSTGSVSMSSSKRGLAYNDVSLTDLFSGKDVGWAYAWSAYSGGSLPSGMEFVPQFWGPTKISQDDWTSAVNSAISSGTSHLLSINEPDNSGQANMAASDAAASHIQYMNPFEGKASIGSPAVTNGGAPSGLTYMQSFFDACDGKCSVDFMVIHWYSGYYDGVDTDFESYVTDAIGVASKNGIGKVWITEFALSGATNAQQATFLDSVVPWLDQQSGVERYAFFMCSDGLLVSGSSISEDIGVAYLSLTS